jgi:molybdate transport system substrate-binding protein
LENQAALALPKRYNAPRCAVFEALSQHQAPARSMTRAFHAMRRVTVLLLVAGAPHAAPGADIKVLAGSGVQPVMNELIPQFERTSGHNVIFDYGTIGGMAARVQSGEAADVIIASDPQLAELEREGKIVPNSRTPLGNTGIGIFVRQGAAKPDIGSVEAFKRTMLAAKSIGWNDPAAGAPVSIYMLGAFERLGIAHDMKPKTTAFKERSERFAAVARGDVEIGFNQISEILAAPGIELVGPLPAPIQHYTLFSAGIVASSNEQDASRDLIRFISSPAARATMTAKGFEAPDP